MSPDQKKPSHPAVRLPRSVYALGLVSLCMDLSSETMQAILPFLLVTSLGATGLLIGFIEGLAEVVSAGLKLVSGSLSDRFTRRKIPMVIGYGLSALVKPLFPLAGSAMAVLAARLLDRVGKGIRGAPRDALIADLVPPERRGAAYGLRQTLDNWGAMFGPLLAVGLARLGFEPREILWVACLPALAAVLILVVGVEEPPRAVPVKLDDAQPRPDKPRLPRGPLMELPRAFWSLVALASLMSFGRFTDAFLLLGAGRAGISLTEAPLLLAVMSGVYALLAWPMGSLADRAPAGPLLALGLFAQCIAHLSLAGHPAPEMMFFGATLWGTSMAMTQGLFSKLIAQLAPDHLRATAFGAYQLVTGFSLFGSSLVAGVLWDTLGPTPMFLFGAAAAALAGILLPIVLRFTRPRA